MDIKRVILVSATMVQKTLNLLGISPGESDFYEYPSSFPARRSPVYLWGACRVDHKTVPEYLDVWIARIDNIIRKRLDRKGIIHTVSYDRAKFIKQRSEFAAYMIVPPAGRDTQDSIAKFKASSAPAILMSPAITTGYDFARSECEYNIIVKVPFIDSRSPIIAARMKEDPDYGAYVTAQSIVQAHGRSMRSEDDQSETVIIDSHITWFIRKFKHLFPSWFHRLTLVPNGMPEPPAPLPVHKAVTNGAGHLSPLTIMNEEPF